MQVLGTGERCARWRGVGLALALAFSLSRAHALEPLEPPDTSLQQTLSQHWRWRELLRDDTRPSFRCVRAGPDGTLIAADDDGLWRYDGHDWTLEPSSDHLRLFDLMDFDRLGEGWVLARRSRLTWFDPAMEAIAPGSGERQIEAGTEGFSLPVAAPDGRLVCAIQDRLVELTPTGVLDLLPMPPGSSTVNGLEFDSLGQAWATTNIGISRHDGSAWHAVALPGQGRSPANQGWVVRRGDQLAILPRVFSSVESGYLWDGRQLRALDDAEAQGEVQDVLVTPQGELLVLIRHAGVRLLEGESWRRAELPASFDDSLVSVALTTDGRLAAVTLLGRLLLHDHASRRWERFDPWPVNRISSIVNALAPSRRGGYWLGTHEGVTRFADGEFHEAFQRADDVDLPLFGVTDVLEDELGQLWVAAGGSMTGVLRWDGDRWYHHAQPEVFGGSSVHAIEQNPEDGSLWFMLLSQDAEAYRVGGIAIWNGRSWRVERGPHEQGLDRTYSLLFEPDGSAVVGLLGGIGWLTDDSLRVDEGQPFGPGSKAFSLFLARDGTIWAGLELRSPGVARLRRGAATWEVMAGPGWDEAGAGDIAQTSDGDLWLASETGLFRVHDDLCLRVTTRGVVPGGNFWPIEVDPHDDSLWVGSMGAGLLHLRPDDDEGPVSRLVETVTPDARVFHTQRVSWRTVDAWASSPADALRHRVRLDGGPWSEWSAPGAAEEQLLEHLAPTPPQHRFEIQAIDASGNRAEPPLAVELDVVAPPLPLWRQPPMLALLTLLLMSTASVIMQMVRRRREQRLAAKARTELNARLRDLTSRLMSSQEEERRRIARDLHDDLGQLLTVTALQLEHGMTHDDPVRRGDSLRRALQSAHAAIDSVRSLAARVRPTSLDDLGLEAAVQTTLEEFAASTGLEICSELHFDDVEIPAASASHVYRILKEGLTNVVRHAGASRVDVTLSVSERAIDLCLRDDGRGFRQPAGPASEGVGLLGIRERAESLNGRFVITSAPGQGTTITVWIPLADASRDGGDR